MGLNISKGNMYSFITHTWNVIKGKCYHDCLYCYMKKFKLYNTRFDEYELKTDLGKNNFIFVGSGCDMFADNISVDWILRILAHCRKFDNYYLFQSKNPKNFLKYETLLPDKTVLCTTIETDMYFKKIMGNSPFPEERAKAMSKLYRFHKYVTIEPIMDFNLTNLVELIKMCFPVMVNIGADSKGHGLPEPSKEDIFKLIVELKKFTIIHKKNNLKRVLV